MSSAELWKEFLDLFKNGWADITGAKIRWADQDPRVLVAALIGILTAVVCCVVTHKRIARRKKQKEFAIQTKRVIKAKCVRTYKDYDTDEDTGTWEITHHGVYEYTVDGKTKRYRVHSSGGLPYVYLPLYYTDSPKKVFSDYDNPQLGYNLSILLGIAAFLLTMYLTSYIL